MMLFDGCSWTMGCELEGPNNDHDKRKRERWSTLVSDHFKTDHVNLGEGGKSNDGILRTTIAYCENHKVDFAVIQFTKANRREILRKDYYRRLNASKRESDIVAYYKHLNTLEDDIANYYKNKFLLEQYFKSKQIPYYFVQLNRRKHIVTEYTSTWQQMSDSSPIPCLYDILGGRNFPPPYFDYRETIQEKEEDEREEDYQKLINRIEKYGIELIREELLGSNRDKVRNHSGIENLRVTVDRSSIKRGKKHIKKKGTHPNAKGHRKIADFLIENVSEYIL